MKCIMLKMTDAKKTPTYPLRLSQTMYDRIKDQAKAEDRSMNYIIVRALKPEFGDEETKPRRKTDATSTEGGGGE